MSDQRKTRGKQKIEMKMIAKEEDRSTTFSKRKSGIYKKANELATLCGAEISFMTFSPTGNPFSFAQPSMESIEKRLIDINNPPPRFNPSTISDDHPLIRAHQQSKLEGLNQYYTELASILEGEKAKRKAIDKLMENSAAKNESGKGWWETSVDNLGYEELLQMNESLEDIHKKLCNHINGDRRTNNNTNAFRDSGKNPI
ncbi:hypothetical protein TIFTF001_012515 [Ficus carica]|uniref:MADS-box domain-containing protein n=1 Tax=Ficus carica TaxID=3494 RepID=A0AA87ZTH6_FICCA|nr:hypothetical protein TIFTF001_012515 [Ficus carica]